MEILKRLKASEGYKQIPVIMATAKGSEYDKVSFFELGADDYLVKPFGMLEMVARVKAVLRRCAEPETTKKGLGNNRLELRVEEHIVMVDGKKCHWGRTLWHQGGTKLFPKSTMAK